MPRTPRHSFPRVHSLYLSEEQDDELRDFADRNDVTVSEVMRMALADYLARADSTRSRAADDDPSPETRMAIAQSARLRKLARGARRAPALPGQTISSSATIWQPPPGLRAPKTKRSYAASEYPMSLNREGDPVEPPENAVAWRVLVQRFANGPRTELRRHGRPLLFDLRVKHHEFLFAVGQQSAAFYLQPVDESGRVLRFTEVYVPLGDAANWEDD